jgi:hypothetical protein
VKKLGVEYGGEVWVCAITRVRPVPGKTMPLCPSCFLPTQFRAIPNGRGQLICTGCHQDIAVIEGALVTMTTERS